MVDESFASSIVLSAIILLGFFTLLALANIVFISFGVLPFLMDPIFLTFMMVILWGAIVPSALCTFVGIILIITWLGWRHNPSEHRNGLKITGVIAAICCGVVPGILAIVAGAMEPQIAKPYTHTPPMLPQPTEIQRCPYCGAEASPTDIYCWKCGSAFDM